MSERDGLEVPDAAKQDAKSFEVLRVWVAKSGQHVSLRAGVWEDPATYGMLLSDLMQHIANAYEQTEGLDRPGVISRIKAGFEAESSFPTDRQRAESWTDLCHGGDVGGRDKASKGSVASRIAHAAWGGGHCDPLAQRLE